MADEKSRIDPELLQVEAQLRSHLAEVDKLHLELCAAAQTLLDRLRAQLMRAKKVVATLSSVNDKWAEVAVKHLSAAIQDSEIKHGDREANILLGLPADQDGAYEQWVRDMRLGESNSSALVAACRYALARCRSIEGANQSVGTELTGIGTDMAQSCSAILLSRE